MSKNERIYQEIPEHLREEEIKSQCLRIEEGTYKKHFNEQERIEKKSRIC